MDGLLNNLNEGFNNSLECHLIRDLRQQIVRKADGEDI